MKWWLNDSKPIDEEDQSKIKSNQKLFKEEQKKTQSEILEVAKK